MEVLVVEDDEELRELLIDTLRSAGRSATGAANGTEALAHLAGSRVLPNLIILDIQMPLMNGLELLKILRSYVRLAPIPVLIVSATPPQELGALPRTSYLAKPLDTPTFLRTVGSILGQPV